MMPDERTELHMRLRSLTEALGIAHSAMRGTWEAVIEAEDVNPLAVAGELRTLRTALADVRSALAYAIADLEMRADANTVPGSLSRDGVEDSPEVRPPVEHGDEVAF